MAELLPAIVLLVVVVVGIWAITFFTSRNVMTLDSKGNLVSIETVSKYQEWSRERRARKCEKSTKNGGNAVGTTCVADG